MKKRIAMGIAAAALGGVAAFGAAAPASAVEICVKGSDGIVVCDDGKFIWIMTDFPDIDRPLD